MQAPAAAKKILVADPSNESRRSIAMFLRGKGMNVIEAADGAAALSEALRSLPDLLVLDLSLDVLPPERLVRILQANPNTKVIPVFFLGDGNEGIAGFRPEIDGFLRRPLDDGELLMRMRDALFPGSPPEIFPGYETRLADPAVNELVTPEDIAALRARRNERKSFGDPAMDRIVFFIPDPPFLEAVVLALGAFPEFAPERSYFALRRNEGFPMGAFGRIRDGEETSLLFYSFPYLQSASPVWHAVAPRPLGVVAFFRENAADSLEGLMAVSDYASDAGARCMIAAMERSASGFGLGRNTIRLFRNHVEKRGGFLKTHEMERMSAEEIRRVTSGVVRQYLKEA